MLFFQVEGFLLSRSCITVHQMFLVKGGLGIGQWSQREATNPMLVSMKGNTLWPGSYDGSQPKAFLFLQISKLCLVHYGFDNGPYFHA